MKTDLKYISSAFSSSLAQEVRTHRQTCGVDVPCERDRDDGTTNKALRYENKTYWNVPSASSLMLSLKMHTQIPGVDVRFERYRGQHDDGVTTNRTLRCVSIQKRSIPILLPTEMDMQTRGVDVRCEWYSDNGNTNSTQRCIRRTLNVYEWGYQQILLEKDFNSYRMTVSQR